MNALKSLDSQLLYEDVNFKILSGEKILVCCENGCGKTTLVRLITGEIEPDKWSIYINSRISISKQEHNRYT